MALERIAEFVKGLSPAEKERRSAKFLADRFDKIKPHLRSLGVSTSIFGYRDSDDRFVETVKLSFNKKNEEAVRAELANAEIEEIYDPYREIGRWMGMGMLLDSSIGYRNMKKWLDKRQIIIYKGKYINDDDLLRLNSL